MAPRKRTPEPGPVALLAAILDGRPSLPDALCIGRHDLFDAARYRSPGTDQTIALVAAERMCRACPHTTRCPDSLTTRARRATA